jgi:thioester reductase-like protein
VRSSKAESAMDKIIKTLKHYKIYESQHESRIKAVVGDISLPLFGLSRQLFDELASSIDSIYHCGAWVCISVIIKFSFRICFVPISEF